MTNLHFKASSFCCLFMVKFQRPVSCNLYMNCLCLKWVFEIAGWKEKEQGRGIVSLCVL